MSELEEYDKLETLYIEALMKNRKLYKEIEAITHDNEKLVNALTEEVNTSAHTRVLLYYMKNRLPHFSEKEIVYLLKDLYEQNSKMVSRS